MRASPRSIATVTRRAGSAMPGGGLRSARSIRPTIPAFIPIARASVAIAAATGPGVDRSARMAKRNSPIPIFIGREQKVPGLSFARLFEVGVALEAFFVDLQEAAGLTA